MAGSFAAAFSAFDMNKSFMFAFQRLYVTKHFSFELLA